MSESTIINNFRFQRSIHPELSFYSPTEKASSVIQGLQFFDSSSACIAHYQKNSWIKKSVYFIQSIVNALIYLIYKIGLILRRVEHQMAPLIETAHRTLSKKKLVVCLHGLNNNPSQFKSIVDELQKKDLSEMDIFVPRVLNKGNAKLDELVKPIFKEIAKWDSTPGEKELVLISISNGGRISRETEVMIAKSPNNIKKIHVISIVSAGKGSSLVNLANKIGLHWLVSKSISEEMPTDSQRTLDLDRDWKKALKDSHGISREYTFIASPHDLAVPNKESTLPEVDGHKARYALVPGHGHNSIVNAVAKIVSTHPIFV